jgi:hypothetical protein
MHTQSPRIQAYLIVALTSDVKAAAWREAVERSSDVSSS